MGKETAQRREKEGVLESGEGRRLRREGDLEREVGRKLHRGEGRRFRDGKRKET